MSAAKAAKAIETGAPWWARLLVGTALTVSVGPVGWLALQVWSDMGRRVTWLEGEVRSIRAELTTIGKQVSGVHGLVQGFIASLPLKQRAEAYGIRPVAIERLPLVVGRTIRMRGEVVPGSPYDLRLTVASVDEGIVRIQIDGTVGTITFEDVGARITLKPGAVAALPLTVTGLPPLYVVTLERRSDAAIVAMGSKIDPAT